MIEKIGLIVPARFKDRITDGRIDRECALYLLETGGVYILSKI
jgi:hypothetical protein